MNNNGEHVLNTQEHANKDGGETNWEKERMKVVVKLGEPEQEEEIPLFQEQENWGTIGLQEERERADANQQPTPSLSLGEEK